MTSRNDAGFQSAHDAAFKARRKHANYGNGKGLGGERFCFLF